MLCTIIHEIDNHSEVRKNKSLSIQTLIQEFQSGVLETDELEYQDNPTRTVLLPLLVNQLSNIDVKKINNNI